MIVLASVICRGMQRYEDCIRDHCPCDLCKTSRTKRTHAFQRKAHASFASGSFAKPLTVGPHDAFMMHFFSTMHVGQMQHQLMQVYFSQHLSADDVHSALLPAIVCTLGVVRQMCICCTGLEGVARVESRAELQGSDYMQCCTEACCKHKAAMSLSTAVLLPCIKIGLDGRSNSFVLASCSAMVFTLKERTSHVTLGDTVHRHP